MSRSNSFDAPRGCPNPVDVLDFSSPRTVELEQDLLGVYFKDSPDFQQMLEFDLLLVDVTTNIERFSLLTSGESTTQSTDSSEMTLSIAESEMDKSNKLTEATRDTYRYFPSHDIATDTKHKEVTREIFLISKLKKREPRRSFDLGELTQGQEIVFEKAEPKVYTPTTSMCVDKEKLAILYNKMVDEGRCLPEWIKKINNTENQILEIMLKLRLTLTKTIPESHSATLLQNLDELNQLLRKSTFLKKRSEELLKKNFKTVLKALLEKERKQLPKGTSAMESRIMFTNKYFGDKARTYDKIFKCIQMSQDYYTGIFKFPEFKTVFSEALSNFMGQFLKDRISKTENLISQIKSDLISGNAVKPNLRTPWSVKEAEASMKLMSQFL